MRYILRRAERGSVLFIILIAVALFAALGYAVSNMMQSGSSGLNINDEKASIEANDILDYGRRIRQAVQAIRINGCSDTDISFENPIIAGYENGTDTNCQVFDSDGGGMSYIAPSSNWLEPQSSTPLFYGEHYFAAGVIASDIGTAARDLVYYIPYVTREICIQINDKVGIENPGGEPPIEAANGWTTSNVKFVGDYDDGGVQLQRGGSMNGCFEGNNSGSTPPEDTYHFYQILVAR